MTLSSSSTGPGRRVILRGGSVVTPDTAPPPQETDAAEATALCVEGGTIVWLGPDIGLAPYADDADEIVDLAGRLVTPAFVDAHVHMSQTGLKLASLDLSDVRSKDDLLTALAAFGRERSDAVVLGFGWDETRWADATLPSGTEIDRAAPGRAVYLARVDVHSALVSATLVAKAPDIASAAGWDGTGRVERDAHHHARDAAQDLVARSGRREAIGAALDAAARAGLGCVHEMSAPHVNPADDLTLIDELAAERATVEVIRYWGEHASAGGVEHATLLGCAGAAGDLCVDGAFGSRTAALCAPYADRPDLDGHLYLEPTEVAEHLVACTRAGLQAGFHCIGDAAVAAVAEGFRLAEKLVGSESLKNARHRLEHVEMVTPELVGLFASYGIVVSGQPAFDAAWGGSAGMYATRLGADRALATNPWASFVAGGVPLAFGSDSPVTPFEPWGAVCAAMHHHDAGARISLEDAFAAHTSGGWYAAGNDTGGLLRAGADATFAVWDVEGPALPALEPGTPSPQCLRTVVAGRTVHDTGALATKELR